MKQTATARQTGRSAMRGTPTKIGLVSLVWAVCCASPAVPQGSGIVATAPGRVEGADGVMPIGTAATGIIRELPVHEGERVRSGQLLVRIECTSIERELAARTHALGAAEATLARVVQGPRPEEIAIGVANVGFAEARWEEAGIVLRRGQ